MHTIADTFGPDLESDRAARADQLDPQTPATRPYSSAEHAPSMEPPFSALHALTDPRNSAIFWVAAAALIGLVLVTGQVRFEAAAASRLGRR